MTVKIAILLFEEVDLLDSGGPYEVFLTASRLAARDGATDLFEVVTVSLDGKPVTAYGGLGLIPSDDFDAALAADVLIVPGTIDIAKASSNESLINALSKFAQGSDKRPDSVIASVCTGAFLLARAGLLDGKPWTTHWEDVEDLGKLLDLDNAVRDKRWVDSGSTVTAAGLASGIDMALHLVERLASRDLAVRTARQIDYTWSADRLTS